MSERKSGIERTKCGEDDKVRASEVLLPIYGSTKLLDMNENCTLLRIKQRAFLGCLGEWRVRDFECSRNGMAYTSYFPSSLLIGLFRRAHPGPSISPSSSLTQNY